MTVGTSYPATLAISTQPATSLSDGLRVAVYHNLHSGGAKRVVHDELVHMARPDTWKVFAPGTADLRFAAGDRPSSIPSLILPFQPAREFSSPFGRLNPLLRIMDLFRFNVLSRRFAQIIDAAGFDVVFVHPCQLTQAPLVLNWLKTPTLYYCQELPRHLYEPAIPRPMSSHARLRRRLDRLDPLEQAHRALLKILDRRAAHRATRIIVNSRFSARNIQRAYGRTAEVCYPAVEPEAFEARPRPRERLVLSVGALTPNKGFDWIIRGIGTLPQQGRPPLVLVSNYAEQAEQDFLAGLAAEQGVQVEFHVGIGDAALREWYARAGTVAYAPVGEPLGLVPLEAMAAGAPVVGVAEGGVCETVVDGVSGLLVARDPVAIGAAIDQVLTDRALAARLGVNGRQQVREEWSWTRHTAQVEHLLWQTARAGGGGERWYKP